MRIPVRRRLDYSVAGGTPYRFGDIVVASDEDVVVADGREEYDRQHAFYAGYGDIVVASDEDVVIADSYASNDMLQDNFQGLGASSRRIIKRLFQPVGGGPFPYVKMRATGPVQFADDQIASGDEGLGYAQAQRLKRKLGRNKRRLTTTGRYAVAAGTPYNYGFGAVSFSPVNALKGGIVGGVIGGFAPKIQLKSRSTLEAERGGYYDRQYAAAIAGSAAALEDLRQQGAVSVPNMPGPPWPRIAPSQGSKDYAAAKYQQAVVALRSGAPAIVPTAPGAPAPAPTSSTTDATGAPLPPSIMQASASQPAVGVNQSAAPTASEQVAAAAQDDQTAADFGPQQAGLFGNVDLKDPKVLLTLVGLGIFVLTQTGGSRRRSRRR